MSTVGFFPVSVILESPHMGTVQAAVVFNCVGISGQSFRSAGSGVVNKAGRGNLSPAPAG